MTWLEIVLAVLVLAQIPTSICIGRIAYKRGRDDLLNDFRGHANKMSKRLVEEMERKIVYESYPWAEWYEIH